MSFLFVTNVLCLQSNVTNREVVSGLVSVCLNIYRNFLTTMFLINISLALDDI